MDRSVLEGDPHVVLEAMAIAGYAIGASQGLYLRPCGVSHRCRTICRLPLDRRESTACLGKNIFGTDF